MAVHAQYPSNILLLNSNGQEGHDYSLQSQPGGFLDQSHMLFNNGGSADPRKRGREVPPAAATTAGGGVGIAAMSPAAATATTTTINPFSIQQTQPPQLIDLSQLHNNNHPNVVSTGLRLSFAEQQQHNRNHHYHYHHHQQQQQQNYLCQSSPVISQDFVAQIKQQRDEIDKFLQTQGDQLRRTLAENWQRHYRALLAAADESITRRLSEKAAEVERATRRNTELEARAAQLRVEAQVWQAKARAQEATAAFLQAQLQQAMMSGGAAAQDSRRGDEGAGCAGGVEGQAEDAESAYVDPDRVNVSSGGPSCKVCRKRAASVVLLSCRHLCVCTKCDQVIKACPLCLHVRNSGVEVFLY